MNDLSRNGQSCKTCLFWDGPCIDLPDVEGQEAGSCLRFPPAFVNKGIGCFPDTYDINWCGEWKPTEPSTEAEGK